MFKFLSDAWHHLLKTHSVEAILSDFTKTEQKLRALAARKLEHADIHSDLADAHHDIALDHERNQEAAELAAAQASKAADKIAALVS